MRTETRAQRYANKSKTAKRFNLHFVTTYFSDVGNIAFLSRALACFGGMTMHVIGKEPERAELKRLSGGNSELVKWRFYSNPMEYLCSPSDTSKGLKLVAAEICDGAQSLHDYKWNYDMETHILLGNEMDGIPVELMKWAEKVYVPMPGNGFCLNTSQTGNIFAYDYAMKMGKL